MRSIILATLCSLLLAGCGTTENKTEGAATATSNAETTKVCKEAPATTGSRMPRKICK